MAENKKILLGLTTTLLSNWREKIKEASAYNIEEIALFPTTLDVRERKELYKLLEKSPIKNIPHVHLRHDMAAWELEYLTSRFRTRAFNIHPERGPHPLKHDLSSFFPRIYVENLQPFIPIVEELEKFGGLCVDFSHWEDAVLLKEKNKDSVMKKITKQFPIGCSHVSAIKTNSSGNPFFDGQTTFSSHWIENMRELDYVKKYLDYLPEYISIELENPFGIQLEVKKYLEEIIKG